MAKALLAIGVGLLLAACGDPAPPDDFAIFMAECTGRPAAPYTAVSTATMCECGWHVLDGATDPKSVNVAASVCSALLVREK